MGNSVSARSIRVVHADGKVQYLRTSILASELVTKDPYSLVCHSSSLRVGHRPCPLHPNADLELGNLYFILPIRTFQSKLTWSHVSFLTRCATSEKGTRVESKRRRARKMSHTLQIDSTLFRVVLKGDTIHITATLEYLERIREEGLLESVVKSPNLKVDVAPEVQARYIHQLIKRCNAWLPTLGTIEEIR